MSLYYSVQYCVVENLFIAVTCTTVRILFKKDFDTNLVFRGTKWWLEKLKRKKDKEKRICSSWVLVWLWMDQQMMWEEVTANKPGELWELLLQPNGWAPACPTASWLQWARESQHCSIQQGKGELPAEKDTESTAVVVQRGDFKQTVLGQVFPQRELLGVAEAV